MPENRDEYFVFEKNSPIILYGAATIGCLLDEYLTDFGYLIKGFMDLRAAEIKELHGKKVYSPDSADLPKDSIIIIAVKNVFEHSRIAEDLSKKGFCKLIYRPYASLKGQGDQAENQLNNIYDLISDYKERKVPFEGKVPVSHFTTRSLLKLSGIVSEADTMLTVNIPITLLFSDRVPQMPEFSVLFMRPHLSFVKYILGMAGGESDSFLRYCRDAATKVGGFETTALWENNVVRNQAEVYAQMNHMYDLDKNFFIDQAPKVQWNEKRYFNLQSGKHRSTFLAAKGNNYIAVQMSKEDFNAWVQASVALEIEPVLREKYRQGLSVPIENPYFYEYSCLEEPFWYQLVRTVMERVSEIDYQNSSVNLLPDRKFSVALSDSGFTKRFIKRCGFQVATWLETDELEKKLDILLGDDFACKTGSNQDWQHVDYMIWEDGIDVVSHKDCEVENLFLVTDKKSHLGDRIMEGMCKGRQVNVYLIKHAVL